MLTNEFRRMSLAVLLVASLGYGCSGKIAGGGSSGTGATTGSGGSTSTGSGGNGNVDAGGVTVKPTTFTPALAGPTCRKIKDLLVGMPCTEADVNAVVTIPTGKPAFSAGNAQFTGNFNWGYTINSEFGLAGTLGFNAASAYNAGGQPQSYFAFIPSVLATAALPGGSVDLIVLNSVAQYLKIPELAALLAQFRALLAPGGKLVVGDVIPPDTSAVTEVTALMKLAWRNGFLLPALAGLVRTALSDYPSLRTKLGLTHYTEPEILAVLARAGFDARRRHPNIEHNQARMTFVATVAAAKAVSAHFG